MIDLDALQAAAEGASAGGGEWDARLGRMWGRVRRNGRDIVPDEGFLHRDLAAHIAAADPSTVLALVAAVRAARAVAALLAAGVLPGDATRSALRAALAAFDGDGQP